MITGEGGKIQSQVSHVRKLKAGRAAWDRRLDVTKRNAKGIFVSKNPSLDK